MNATEDGEPLGEAPELTWGYLEPEASEKLQRAAKLLADNGYAIVKLPKPTHRSTTTGLVMFPGAVSAWPPIRGHNAKVRLGNALKNVDFHPDLVPEIVGSLLAASKELAP